MSILLFLFCLTASVAAQGKWISVRTKNFHLTGNASETDIRAAGTKLEQFRESFRLVFPDLKVTSPIPTSVIVFENAAAYRPYKPKRADGKTDEAIAGFFQAGEDVNYITLSANAKDGYGTIFHEYVHFLLDVNYGTSDIPPWLNEGLAEYYQTFRIDGARTATLGEVQNGHLRLLRQGQLIPLKDFFETDSYTLNQNADHSRSVFYAQAWALMHYLLGTGGSGPVSKFLSLTAVKTAHETAFRQAFGIDYAAAEKALMDYIAKGQFATKTVTLPSTIVFDNGTVVAQLSQSQRDAHLGDLLYRLRDYAAAEEHLLRAVGADANLGTANASLGLVKMRQRDFGAAKKYLERAIAVDQKNHLTHYNYAYVLSRESIDEFGFVEKFPPENVGRMRESLKKAIELNPDFAESYRLLAFVNMTNGESLDESLELVKTGLSLIPGNQNFELLAAQIYLRQEKFDAAKMLAERLAKSAGDRPTRLGAREVIDAVREYEKASQAVREKAVLVEIKGERAPLILKRESLTEADVARIELERENTNLNRLLGTLASGERRVVASIEKVSCSGDEVRYAVRSEDGVTAMLFSPDIQSLKLSVLRQGTQSFKIGCGTSLGGESVVLTFRPRAGARNELKSIAFVPKTFVLMTADELANVRWVIIEGGPATDISKNAEIAAREQAEFERQRREDALQQIADALRTPLEGETRILGTVERIECLGGASLFRIHSGDAFFTLNAPLPKEIKPSIFTPDADRIQFGCGVSLPPVNAVITYRPSKDGGDLVSLEFVPKSFQLN